jgi:hypothetical protein
MEWNIVAQGEKTMDWKWPVNGSRANSKICHSELSLRSEESLLGFHFVRRRVLPRYGSAHRTLSSAPQEKTQEPTRKNGGWGIRENQRKAKRTTSGGNYTQEEGRAKPGFGEEHRRSTQSQGNPGGNVLFWAGAEPWDSDALVFAVTSRLGFGSATGEEPASRPATTKVRNVARD